MSTTTDAASMKMEDIQQKSIREMWRLIDADARSRSVETNAGIALIDKMLADANTHKELETADSGIVARLIERSTETSDGRKLAKKIIVACGGKYTPTKSITTLPLRSVLSLVNKSTGLTCSTKICIIAKSIISIRACCDPIDGIPEDILRDIMKCIEMMHKWTMAWSVISKTELTSEQDRTLRKEIHDDIWRGNISANNPVSINRIMIDACGSVALAKKIIDAAERGSELTIEQLIDNNYQRMLFKLHVVISAALAIYTSIMIYNLDSDRKHEIAVTIERIIIELFRNITLGLAISNCVTPAAKAARSIETTKRMLTSKKSKGEAKPKKPKDK